MGNSAAARPPAAPEGGAPRALSKATEAPAPKCRLPLWEVESCFRKTEQGVWALTKKRLEALREKLALLKERQSQTLELFLECERAADWGRVHASHFDWWTFPVDDGSKPEFNVDSEAEIQFLRADAEWFGRYLECVRLAAVAWGWDAASSARIPEGLRAKGMIYLERRDVRLAKICRSLYLFEEAELLDSMQRFARDVQEVEKAGRSFTYHRMVLDELLYFQLPRRAGGQMRRAGTLPSFLVDLDCAGLDLDCASAAPATEALDTPAQLRVESGAAQEEGAPRPAQTVAVADPPAGSLLSHCRPAFPMSAIRGDVMVAH